MTNQGLSALELHMSFRERRIVLVRGLVYFLAHGSLLEDITIP